MKEGGSKFIPETTALKKMESVEKSKFEIFDTKDRELMLEAADHFLDQLSQTNYDALIFLDQGARIWSHLLHARWQHRFPDKKFPEIKYIKVGRELITGYDKMQYYYDHYYDKKTMKEIKKESRKKYGYDRQEEYMLFRQEEANKKLKLLITELQETFKSLPPRILIVDSFIFSGQTLDLAQNLLTHAFSTASFDKAAILGSFRKKEDTRDDLIFKPLGVETDAERKYPSPPSISDHKGAFIKPRYKQIKELESIENPTWRKLLRRLVGNPEIQLSPEIEEKIQTQKQRMEQEQQRYRQAMKEIKEMAVIER